MRRSELGSLGVKRSTSRVGMESAIKAAGLLAARQAYETPGWEHGSLNKSGYRQLDICKPAITELAGRKTGNVILYQFYLHNKNAVCAAYGHQHVSATSTL